MPKLQKVHIEELHLPSFPEDDPAIIKLEVPAKLRDFENIDTSAPQILQTAQIMAGKIKEWNIEGEDGKVLEITAENVAELEPVDFTFLSVQLGLDKMSKLTAKKNVS